MKKIFALILVLITVLALVACGSDDEGENEALDYSQVGDDGELQLPGYIVFDLEGGSDVVLPAIPIDPSLGDDTFMN